jgi:hypothetical protein
MGYMSYPANTSSRMAFTPWRTLASTSSSTSCSNYSCFFGVRCLLLTEPTNYQTLAYRRLALASYTFLRERFILPRG